jgi:hypothetical protein
VHEPDTFEQGGRASKAHITMCGEIEVFVFAFGNLAQAVLPYHGPSATRETGVAYD